MIFYDFINSLIVILMYFCLKILLMVMQEYNEKLRWSGVEYSIQFPWFCWCQGRRKHLNLGGARLLKGTFFLKKKGAFSKNEKATSLFIAKSWMVPPVPPGSYVYGWCGTFFMLDIWLTKSYNTQQIVPRECMGLVPNMRDIFYKGHHSRIGSFLLIW